MESTTATSSQAGTTPLEECARVSAIVAELGEKTARLKLDGGGDGILRRDDMVRPTMDWPISVGDRFTVWIDGVVGDEQYQVSKTKADMLALWDRIAAAAESGETLEGEAIAVVRGGLSVDVGLRAFLPASQATLRPVSNLTPYIGKRLEFVISRFDKKRGNIVLTRRPLLERERKALMEKTMTRITEGDVIRGHVVSLANYGAFVDIGGIDGLLHVDELSWGRINHPSQVVSEGDEIDVKILSIDRDKQKIALGHKQLAPDPWTAAPDKYAKGTKLSRMITSVTAFGAFVELEAGIEGLIHVSEMSWTQRVSNPKALVKVGDEVEVVVLDVDRSKRRVSLGMKQAQENPWTVWAKKYPKGTKLKGKVRSITDFGIFVGVEKGLDGLVHMSEISWTDRSREAVSRFSVGDEVEALVVEIRPDDQRLGLSIKHLSEDPWVAVAKKYPRGAKLRAKVTRTVDFGAFFELEVGVEGLCHISQLSVDRVEKVSDVLKVGDETEVMVIDFDLAKHKVSLSLKALSEDIGDHETYMAEQEQFSNSFGRVLSESLKIADAGDDD